MRTGTRTMAQDVGAGKETMQTLWRQYWHDRRAKLTGKALQHAGTVLALKTYRFSF